MIIGASTSNFYPATLEDSLDTLLQGGFRHVEIFFNAGEEREPAYIADLCRRLDACGGSVCAVHPYTSFMENHFLFGNYERRVTEMLDDYKRNFEAAARLGASFLVLHGARPSRLPDDAVWERYERLYDLGATFGIRVAQENVVQFRSGDPAFLRNMRAALGEKAAFVLDIKQTVRCGLSVEDVADAMGDRIVHVHVSDHNAACDCLPPGQGSFDYRRLFSLLQARLYDGSLIVELYRHNFTDITDLTRAAAQLSDWSLNN